MNHQYPSRKTQSPKKRLRGLLHLTLILVLALTTLCLFSCLTPSERGKQTDPSGLTLELNDDGASYAVTGIGTYADSALVIPSTFNGKPVTAIERNAFSSAHKINSVVIPDSVTTIKANAFGFCRHLISVKLGKGVASIEERAFDYCSSLVEIINNSSLVITAGASDNGNIALNALSVHNGESKLVKENGFLFITHDGTSYLAAYDGNDEAISLPASYNGNGYEILTHAFYQTATLKSVSIPAAVTVIGDRAFSNCSNLSEINIAEGVTEIGEYAFNACKATSLTLPGSISAIGDSAFAQCYNLAEVTLGGAIEDIGELVFADCGKLSKVNVKSLNDWLGNDINPFGGSQYYDLFVDGEKLEEAVIPSGVTSIGKGAFFRCRSIKSVELHEGVTEIGESAFRSCPFIEEIVFPDGVKTIGDYAFNDCEALTRVVFGKDVNYIGFEAFVGCNITKAIFKDPNGWKREYVMGEKYDINVTDERAILSALSISNYCLIKE